jgi:hypothetical protein
VKGGMQSSQVSNFYCPVCSKPVSAISNGIIKHITQKGTVLFCSIEEGIKRKRVVS